MTGHFQHSLAFFFPINFLKGIYYAPFMQVNMVTWHLNATLVAEGLSTVGVKTHQFPNPALSSLCTPASSAGNGTCDGGVAWSCLLRGTWWKSSQNGKMANPCTGICECMGGDTSAWAGLIKSPYVNVQGKVKRSVLRWIFIKIRIHFWHLIGGGHHKCANICTKTPKVLHMMSPTMHLF